MKTINEQIEANNGIRGLKIEEGWYELNGKKVLLKNSNATLRNGTGSIFLSSKTGKPGSWSEPMAHQVLRFYGQYRFVAAA